MPTLVKQVLRLTHSYVAHGGKTNRRQQVARLLLLVRWIQTEFHLTGLQQIGKRQVIAFWKTHRDQASGTADGYWHALRLLWELLERAGEPPRPWPK